MPRLQAIAARIKDCVVAHDLVRITILVEPHSDAALRDRGVEPDVDPLHLGTDRERLPGFIQ